MWRVPFSLGAVVVLALVSPGDAKRVRVATWNVLSGVGAVNGTEYNAVKAILQRMDADVVAFQELRTADFSNWTNLAAETGYGYTAFGGNGPFSGSLYLGYYSRFPILTQYTVTSPPGAVELTRAPLRIEVDVPGAARTLALWNMHHKASSDNVDAFRRAVEAIRIGQDTDAYREANPTHSEFVFLGDMNDDVADAFQPVQFTGVPAGLPGGYVLGSDITLPVPYRVFPTDRYATNGGGQAPLTMFQTGTMSPGTFISSGRRLDYIFVSDALRFSAYGSPSGEVYNSALDTGAAGLPKAGSPPPLSSSTVASDHYALLAEVHMADAAAAGFLVQPETDFLSSGLQGGPFAPTGITYSIINTSAVSVSWRATAGAAWFNLSMTGGVIDVGEGVDLALALTTNANTLVPGTYAADVRFEDLANTGLVFRSARLDVQTPATLSVTPASIFVAAGPPGGPFTPATTAYSVSNAGQGSLTWTANPFTNWIDVVPAGGTLDAGLFTTVTVSLLLDATNLPLGVHTGAIEFVNSSTGLGSTNRMVLLNVSTGAVGGLFHDFESGALGWTAEGLWHLVTNGAACAEAHSPVHAWYYGLDSSCTYNTGTINSGHLVSASMVIPTNAQMTFWSWEETEDTGITWDRRRVFISTNAGSSWIQLHQSVNRAAAWYRVTLNLAAYAGSTAQIRFTFDTVDDAINDFRGWYMDDVRVGAPALLGVSPGDPVDASGEEGGPFVPAAIAYTVTNVGAQELFWRASASNTWVSLSATTGVLGVSQSVSLFATLNGGAAALPGGFYTNLISVQNTANAANRTNLSVQLLVRDGIPDAWRLTHFGHIEPSAGDLSRANDDADDDGMLNREEYRADTQPTNDQSALLIQRGFVENGIPMIEWKGGVLAVQILEVLAGGASNGSWAIVFTNVPPTAVTNTLSAPVADDSGWYRIGIAP